MLNFPLRVGVIEKVEATRAPLRPQYGSKAALTGIRRAAGAGDDNSDLDL